MPVRAISATAKAVNGVGAFILECKRLDFHYCDWAGSSRGMNLFLKQHLPALAKRSPSLEMHVSPRPSAHPVIRAHYINPASNTPKTKAICVRNLSPGQVLEKAVLLRDGTGNKNRRVTGGKMVRSMNESVRGIWSPLHGEVGPLRNLTSRG